MGTSIQNIRAAQSFVKKMISYFTSAKKINFGTDKKNFLQDIFFIFFTQTKIIIIYG